MFLKSAVLVLLGVSSSFAMPANGKSENKKINLVKVKPGLKHKLLDEALLKESLERPIDNLVEPEYPDFDASHLLDPTLTGLTAPAPRPVLPSADLEAPVSADVFPIREGFATGHTIPLEILERIAGHNSRYVDSSAFRARVVEQPSQYFQPPTSELTFPEPSRLLSPPHRAANTIYSHAAAESILPETTAFASLSDEGDSTFSRTLDRFITDLDY